MIVKLESIINIKDLREIIMNMNWKLLSASLLGIFLVACDDKKEEENKTDDATAAAAAPMVEEPKADAAPAADAATPAEAPKEEPKAS